MNLPDRERIIPSSAAARLDTSLELLLGNAPQSAGAVLATVVATAGSTYRKPGARMLILEDGSCIGLLSGGCLESDLMVHARGVRDSGVARVVEYDMRGPDDVLYGIGAGCEGAMRVLLEPAGTGTAAGAALAAAGAATGAGMAAALLAIHESTRYALGTYAQPPASAALAAAVQSALAGAASREIMVEESGMRTRALVQCLVPPPFLLICGAGPDAQPVVSTARGLGWRVAVFDHRPAYAVAEHFPGASVYCAPAQMLRTHIELSRCHAAVVMSHHLASDTTYLRLFAEESKPGYIGLLGPAARRKRLFDDLGSAAEALRPRLHGPVGIDIGAVTPEGIALSIVAQIHAWLAGREMA